jgi:hypothetical protein
LPCIYYAVENLICMYVFHISVLFSTLFICFIVLILQLAPAAVELERKNKIWIELFLFRWAGYVTKMEAKTKAHKISRIGGNVKRSWSCLSGGLGVLCYSKISYLLLFFHVCNTSALIFSIFLWNLEIINKDKSKVIAAEMKSVKRRRRRIIRNEFALTKLLDYSKKLSFHIYEERYIKFNNNI